MRVKDNSRVSAGGMVSSLLAAADELGAVGCGAGTGALVLTGV